MVAEVAVVVGAVAEAAMSIIEVEIVSSIMCLYSKLLYITFLFDPCLMCDKFIEYHNCWSQIHNFICLCINTVTY